MENLYWHNMNHDFFFTKVRWPNFLAHFGKKKPKTILHCTLCYCKERQKKEQVSEKEKQKKGESKKRNAETKLKENGNTKIQKFPRLRNKASRRKKERKIHLFSGKRKRSYNIQIFFSFTSFPPFLSGDTPFDSGNSKTSDLSPEKKLSELSRHNFHKQNYRRLTKLILVRASMVICQLSA